MRAALDGMASAAAQDREAPVLSVRGVAKVFGSGDTRVAALAGVSLEAHAGELVGVVGESGSGKSTMLLIAGLLEPPSEGEIWLSGTRVSTPQADLDALRDLRRTAIGFVFQKANLIPFLTAGENVALALTIDDVPLASALPHAETMLTQLGLGHRLGARPTKLSGGEQSRVAIARALATDPALILADEPTAALDSVRGRQVMELLRTIADHRRAAVVVVTHDQRSLDLFDRTYVFSDGKVVECHRPRG
ncbi:ABC transporter ATP-binding protein [Acuticoccus sp. MNP-M23]|uniref:ABC transporter ATP-binding protein n=1 Tax=Acuticoccus sp. MNP-M23 TaxID=3072793 RepID=UPI002814F53D|nr:ABC transporter ATP-binding protein [Acuticoccus sp. MNP-M23]WMS43886.1 ABC transporter ATP-binding protein [Acuticoccus sp. MNP-M23]